jgi:DNA (cytosine-5)-methyltransferase 1
MGDGAAYYNEIDAYAAAWLRNLIAAGHIAPGDVDTRSIVEVQPDDLRGYTQAHFFAGIGVWSHAARLAGVADDQPLWTGSCPCQPFSAAGKQRGTDDERHLWPEFHRLIRECRPPVVLGEQVASALGRDWLDAVRADLEAVGYAVGAADLGAASVGAPHIRQRLWWVADAYGGEPRQAGAQWLQRSGQHRQQQENGVAGVALGDASSEGLPARQREAVERAGRRQEGRTAQQPNCASGGLADAALGGRREQRDAVGAREGRHADGGGDASGWLADAADGQLSLAGRGSEERDGPGPDGQDDPGGTGRPSALYGFWRDADWLLCRDGKWRPVEPGTFPLAHGAASRVGRLRAYGNAIVAPLAAEFIAAVMECQP